MVQYKKNQLNTKEGRNRKNKGKDDMTYRKQIEKWQKLDFPYQ